MNYKIFPPRSRRSVKLTLPLSKSISNRTLIMSAMSGSGNPVPELAKCDDTEAMVKALLSGDGELNVGAAGTAMRFLTAYFAVKNDCSVVLDGSERMRNRPIGPLVDALVSLGASIEYAGREGFPPLVIKGCGLKGGEVSLSASVSSQYVSALMMVAPAMESGLVIKLTGQPVSMPYIIMTLMMMMRRGIQVMFHDNTITILPGKYSPVADAVEGDWSAASYLYEIVALGMTDNIMVSNLTERSLQGDAAVGRIFSRFGVGTNFCGDGDTVLVKESQPASMLEIDMSGQPDLAQTVAVTASMLSVPFRLTGLSTLPSKETDRLQALETELKKFGIDVHAENGDSLVWDGTRTATSGTPRVSTYNDHRMAMAFAPAAIAFPGLVIEDIDVVSKSYPQYWSHLEEIGFKLVKCD